MGKRVQKKNLKKSDKTPTIKASDVKKIEDALNGDKEITLFFLHWLKLGRNATKAYKALHPDVSIQSATVLGCRMLSKVNISAVLEAYGIGIDSYFKQLQEGLNASTKKEIQIGMDDYGPVFSSIDEPDHKTRRPYHETLGKLLGIESKDDNTIVPVQINNIINDKKNEYGI